MACACYRVGVVSNAQQGSRDDHPGISFALSAACEIGKEIGIIWAEALGANLLRAASADHSAGTPSGIASCGAVLSSELAGARLSPKRKIATIT